MILTFYISKAHKWGLGMKFNSLCDEEFKNDLLKAEFESGEMLGVVCLGESHLFFRKTFKTYFVSYEKLTRVFRRVYLIPRGKRQVSIENIVVCSADKEIYSLSMTGKESAVILLDKLKEKAPHIETTCAKE